MRRYSFVDAGFYVIEAEQETTEFESLFRSHYARMCRVIARVVRDHARAEELAVEAFLKLWKNPGIPAEMAEAWLYRTAVRKGLDELRSRTRRLSYEKLLVFAGIRTPEEISAETEECRRVQSVLASIERRQAELLVLRSDGLAYSELAAALKLNPASIGTLLSRAQAAFKTRYLKLYGERTR